MLTLQGGRQIYRSKTDKPLPEQSENELESTFMNGKLERMKDFIHKGKHEINTSKQKVHKAHRDKKSVPEEKETDIPVQSVI